VTTGGGAADEAGGVGGDFGLGARTKADPCALSTAERPPAKGEATDAVPARLSAGARASARGVRLLSTRIVSGNGFAVTLRLGPAVVTARRVVTLRRAGPGAS
jgi:hypothetical protein